MLGAGEKDVNVRNAARGALYSQVKKLQNKVPEVEIYQRKKIKLLKPAFFFGR